jgi:Cu(I)/Ag(I) efflux system membrane fusion protein
MCILLVFRFCSNKPEQEKVVEQKPAPLSVSQNSGAFNQSFSKLLQSYFMLKNAFTDADISKVNSAAVQLMNDADSLRISEIQGDTSGMIRETARSFATSISGSARTMTGEDKVEDKLREFNMITDAMWSLTRTVKYDGQKVYYQFCPAALDNMGGYWLSDKIDSANPYIRDKSKSCSEVNDSLDYSRR